MTYRVAKTRIRQNNTMGWRVICESWGSGKRTDQSILQRDLDKHGFTDAMTIEEAREHAKFLNSEPSEKSTADK